MEMEEAGKSDIAPKFIVLAIYRTAPGSGSFVGHVIMVMNSYKHGVVLCSVLPAIICSFAGF